MGLLLTAFNCVNLLLPDRPCYGLRRAWLRLAGIRIGKHACIAAGARLYDRFITIGDRAWIGPETSILSCRHGAVTVGDRVAVGPGVMLVSGSHRLGSADLRAGPGTGHDILIGAGSWICAAR